MPALIEYKAENFNTFLKAIGISKFKRSIAKKIDLILKFKTLTETTYRSASRAGPFKTGPDTGEFGKDDEDKEASLGHIIANSVWNSEKNCFYNKTTIVKGGGDVVMKKGDYTETEISKDEEKNELVLKTWFNGDTSNMMVKYLKFRGAWESQNDKE